MSLVIIHAIAMSFAYCCHHLGLMHYAVVGFSFKVFTLTATSVPLLMYQILFHMSHKVDSLSYGDHVEV